MRSRALDRLRALNTVQKYINEHAAPEIEATTDTNATSCVVDHLKARSMLEKLNPVQRTVH